MNKQYKQETSPAKGFTIIEVVLVLAIAGLIFLMVFIALPALQRGQRDAQRKQDLSRISVQMTNYLTSSRGQIPTVAQLNTFVTNYLRRSGETTNTQKVALSAGEAGSDYVDPNGNNYALKSSAPTALGQIGYFPQRLCDANSSRGDGIADSTTANRDYAFTIQLESQNVPFCLDNKS